ncbi:biotin transporter BioY [Anaerotruncus rubiinfantis]|uniref:biotin transporter BioY n=1 Tax=Anaerotruncus rubiinfantis TaxID=1720200 RepID=UPI000829A922|nr:biotin transporter BioY [Anaerotruncus rubiinfantis]
MKQRITTHDMILCALFAALTALLSQLAIPLQPVPINLATLAVFLAGGILGAKYGALSQLVYVLVGAVGAPVFSSFTGGVGILVGPTGGYIAGYIMAALLVGWMTEKFGKTNFVLVSSMLLGMAVYDLLGTAWFMISTGTGLMQSLALCVVPFLFGDALKILAAAILVPRICGVLRRGPARVA